MIPANITREHILQAITDIIRNGVPPGRAATKFALEYEGRLYPPKLVISLANRHANGSELDPSTFSGGQETNQFLRHRGFQIVQGRMQVQSSSAPTSRRAETTLSAHGGERCPACKARFRELLIKLYGRVEERYSLGLGTQPEDFQGTPHYETLRAIHADLVAHRGFKDFIRARQLPPCDYFVKNPGFIVEFDESQHFTTPRALTLQRYPTRFRLGYDRDRWLRLCAKICARDPDPPFRDEQRAWYDTLRDFAPARLDLRATVRLYASDAEWCRLAPERLNDVEAFRKLIDGGVSPQRIRVRADQGAVIARLIISREWPGQPHEARALLETLAEEWPAHEKVDFLVTCGGFVQFPLCEAVSLKKLGAGDDAALRAILERATQVAREVVPPKLQARFRRHTRYVTLGIDTRKDIISTTQNQIREPHAETVIVLDVETGHHHATAKSYPTPAQEKGLIRSTDLPSHFLSRENGDCVMVLGCHDLTIFNPRSANARGWRAQVNADFRETARKRQPVIVLHHPHTADSKMTWRAAWIGLERKLPSVRLYAGAGRHWHPDGPRSPLDETLALTKKGPTLDFIVE